MNSTNGTYNPFPLPGWERNFYLFHVTAVVNTFLSAIGALLVCVIFLFSPTLRSGQIFRAVFYLSLTDFFWVFLHGIDHFHSLVNYSDIPYESLFKGRLCEFIGCIGQFFVMSNALWVLVISLMIFLQTKSISKRTPKISFWMYHVFVWGISITDSFLLLIFGQYGHENPYWCHAKDGLALRYCWIIPCAIIVATIAILYIFLFYEFLTLRSQTAESMKGNIHGILKRLALYPLVFVIVWVPYFTLIVYQWAHPAAEIPFGLTWTVIFFTNLSGVLNSIAYFLTSKVVQSEFFKLCRWVLRLDKDNATNSQSIEPYVTSESEAISSRQEFHQARAESL